MPRAARKHPPVRVCLVESHPLATRRLKEILGPRYALWQLSRCEVATGRGNPKDKDSVFLADAGVLGEVAYESVALLRSDLAAEKILLIGSGPRELDMSRLLTLGVRGFVAYHEVERCLVPAVDAVSRGGLWIEAGILEEFVTEAASLRRPGGREKQFTARERSVLSALWKKQANKEIAKDLNISERTVKFHLENIFAKLGLHDRSAVAKVAGKLHLAGLLTAVANGGEEIPSGADRDRGALQLGRSKALDST